MIKMKKALQEWKLTSKIWNPLISVQANPFKKISKEMSILLWNLQPIVLDSNWSVNRSINKGNNFNNKALPEET